MLLELVHETVFTYSRPAGESYMEFRLTPVTDGSQHVLQHRERLHPSRSLRQYVDAFGNTVSYFNIIGAAERIEVCFDSIVETYPIAYRGAGLASGGLDSPAARLMLHDYLLPTDLTLWCEQFMAFIPPYEQYRGVPTEEAASAICKDIWLGFVYEGDVTTASSPISEVLSHRRGVCQDFSHLMIAICRYLGFPARYVSGYIIPDDEAPVSASHAWVEVFDPAKGWLGIDPTHNILATDRHIRLGVGRDYRDVPPNRGIFRGSAIESMDVRVSLKPLKDGAGNALLERSRQAYRPTPATPAPPPKRKVRQPVMATLMQQSEHLRQQQQQQQQ